MKIKKIMSTRLKQKETKSKYSFEKLINYKERKIKLNLERM